MNMIGHQRLKTPVIGGDYVLQGIVRLARRMFWENERSIVLSRGIIVLTKNILIRAIIQGFQSNL